MPLDYGSHALIRLKRTLELLSLEQVHKRFVEFAVVNDLYEPVERRTAGLVETSL